MNFDNEPFSIIINLISNNASKTNYKIRMNVIKT